MIGIRFHGRGGQGAKISSRIVGRSGFLCGFYAQDFALFGAERRGAPVVSFTRLSATPIDQRGPIERPSLVLVLDPTLLKEAAEQVLCGVGEKTPIIVNSGGRLSEIGHDIPRANFHPMDLSALALDITGTAFISAVAAAVAAKCIPGLTLEAVENAARIELGDFKLAPDLVEKNVTAAATAYARVPAVELAAETDVIRLALPVHAVPYPTSAVFATPTIRRRGSAALRQTGNWRIERPEIELAKCKRCFLCYLYCPEAAMRLDRDDYPYVDYDHCKGCMICYEECPTAAITRRREA